MAVDYLFCVVHAAVADLNGVSVITGQVTGQMPYH